MTQKTALVVGASGGFGRAIAAMLAEEGFTLALVGRDIAKLEAVRGELGAARRRRRARPSLRPHRPRANAGHGRASACADESHRRPHLRRRIERPPAKPAFARSRRLGPRHRSQSHHRFQCDSLRAAVDAHAGKRPDRADLFSGRIAGQYRNRRGVLRGQIRSIRVGNLPSAAKSADAESVPPSSTPAKSIRRSWTPAPTVPAEV